ncbi:MAG: PD40 domain-containing protein [Verrucomicrobia bacterium]|nr:PD40 domain-containing protein [Verrucomicrobiota bacterium]
MNQDGSALGVPAFTGWGGADRLKPELRTKAGSWRARLYFSAIGILALLLFAAAGGSRAGEAIRVGSVAAQVGVTGAHGSFAPTFSADGRFLVFLSQANNLVTNDDRFPNQDVFVCELATGTITLVSVASNGLGGACLSAGQPSISSNGQVVVFSSFSDRLALFDTNEVSDIFIRDLVNGSTQMGSVDTSGLPSFAWYSGSSCPLLSADGQWVFFESRATNLTALVPSPHLHLFGRNLQSNQTVMIDMVVSGTNFGIRAGHVSVSADGRRAAFVGGAVGDLCVWDQNTGVTLWASTNMTAYLGTNGYACSSPVLSANGSAVVFLAAGFSNSPTFLFRHELDAGTTALLASNLTAATSCSLSADGRFTAYDDGTNVFLWDAQTASNVLVSMSYDGTGPANGPSKTPVLTPDGRHLAFVSAATDLVAADTGGKFQVYVRDLTAGITRLSTVNRFGAPSAVDHEFVEPSLTADGQRVAFDSEDDELVADDFNHASDVFVRDVATGTTRLISQRHAARPALTGFQSVDLPTANCLSADGRWLAFVSYDNNLAAGDTNGWSDLYVCDRFTGTNRLVTSGVSNIVNPILSARSPFVLFTELALPSSPRYFYSSDGTIYCHNFLANTTAVVTVRWDGSGPASGGGAPVDISPDGRYVLFSSTSPDLVRIGGNDHRQLFVRDMALGTNYLITATVWGGPAYDYCFYGPQFASLAGQWVFFAICAGDLTTNAVVDFNSPRLYVHDLVTHTTHLASWDGSKDVGLVGVPSVAPDATTVFFASPTASSQVGIFAHNYVTGASALVVDSALYPAASRDGSVLAYRTYPLAPAYAEIRVIDSRAGTTNLVGVPRYATSSEASSRAAPIVTADGRYVVFTSSGGDLVSNDTNGVMDIFVYDRATSNTVALTHSPLTGFTANGLSSRPMLAADGRTILFHSMAGDLVEGDFNDVRDVFLLRLGGGDSDGDGVDDDWEMAFFGTLTRDGASDIDGDGASDGQEFRAGTDPTNQGSVLRAFTLVSVGTGSTTLIWPAVPGRSYRVQFKTDLNDSDWTDLLAPVVVNGASASCVDPGAAGQGRRFYRVVMQP